MGFSLSIPRWASVLLILCLGLAQAHTVITYPGYRGNNLHTNGTVAQANGLGVAYDVKNGSYIFPYGMEWIYPCKQDIFNRVLASQSDRSQVVECPGRPTEPNGPSAVVLSPSSRAGSQVMPLP